MINRFSPEQKKIFLIALVVLAVLAIDVTFLLKPQVSRLSGVRKKLHQAKAALRHYSPNSPSAKKLQAEFDALKSKNSQSEKKAFSDSNIPFILDDISQKASQARVKIMQVSPQAIPPEKNKPLENTPGYRLYPLFIKLQLVCAYHQLGAFLSRVEENQFFSVEDLKIKANSADSARQSAELTIKVYVDKK